MEDALVLLEENRLKGRVLGLNPCFNGRCTRTLKSSLHIRYILIVLILVLMEDALVLLVSAKVLTKKVVVLILVLMEDALVPRASSKRLIITH